MGLEAIGTQGTIFVPDPWHSTQGLLLIDGEEVRVEPTNPYRLELQDVSTAIRSRKQPLLGRADALGQATVIEALYRSAESAVAVSLEG
jgi:xylose dehydrogenase (NAD/NADP)